MNENPNVPAIRFKGFTDPWEQRQLGELGQFYSGIFGKSKADFGHGEARYVTFLNVLNNPIADPSLVAPIEVDARQNVVSEGDILFTMSSETPADVGLSSLWPGSDRTVYLNSFCFGLRPRVSGLGSYYAAAFRAPHFRKDVSLLAQGISRFNISRRRVSELRTAIPSHQEASRIGALFSRLNSLITLHQRKCEMLQRVKKSLLEQMFPSEGEDVPRIRFKGFTDPWEQRQLGEVARHVTERNLDQRLKETFTNSAEYGIISQRDYFDHSISNAGNTHNYVIVAPGDFVYNPRISGLAPVGPIRRNRLGRAGIVSPLYQVFRCEHMSGRFLEHYFFTDKWHNYMVIEGNTGARSNRLAITAISFFALPIPRPTNEEQHRIGSFLDRLDSLITLHQRQLEQLRNLKRALLEKMFV